MNRQKALIVIPTAIFSAGLLGLAITADFSRKKNTTAQDIKDAKEVVLKHDPQKYARTLENSDCLKGWQQAAKEVEDSLRVESLCKKAYFEGAQFVRDSIKNVQKGMK